MSSHEPSLKEVIDSVNALTGEIRALRNYVEDAHKTKLADQAEYKEWYLEQRAEEAQEYNEHARRSDELRRQYEQQYRRGERRFRVSWILTAWFVLVSILAIRWLIQQP